jgi:hypothetical protein
VTLKGFWPERIHFLEERYETLPFPFEEIQPPEFEMEANWNFDNLVGFLGSWSAARKLIEEKGEAAFEEKVE